MDEKKDMPESIKWPRFKSGGPVGINDRFTDRAGIGRTVTCIRFYDSDFSICAYDGTVHYYEYGEPVGPAPVLAADGLPLSEGETVYKLDDDRPYTLKRFDGDYVYINAGGSSLDIWTFPNKLTHERPVRDARGVPIHEGDTVWDTKPQLDEMLNGGFRPGIHFIGGNTGAGKSSFCLWIMQRMAGLRKRTVHHQENRK